MATGSDPFAFDEDCVENRENNFSESFMEMFGQESDSDSGSSEFEGFTREDVYLAEKSRVRTFHLREVEESEDENDEENRDPALERGKKRCRNPSR